MLIDRSLFVATSPLQALTCTCDCPLNDKTGGTVLGSGQTANRWSGIPNYKGWKSSESAPEEGNKYDGIYKVVKYWPEKNKNGFIVWKYLFRRDEVGIFWGKIVTRFNFCEIAALQYAFNLWVKKCSRYMLNSERLYPPIEYKYEVPVDSFTVCM